MVCKTGGRVCSATSDLEWIEGLHVWAERNPRGNVQNARSLQVLKGLRDVPHFCAEVRDGRWRYPLCPYYNLIGKTVGLIGFG